MAVVAASAVTITETWYEGGASGRKFKGVRATIVLSSQGGSTNYFAASLLGLKLIQWSSSFVSSDDTATYPSARSYDGSKIFVVDSHAPTDVSGTFRLIAVGKYPA